MSPKAEHLPLIVTIGQRVRICVPETSFWSAYAGHTGRIIAKSGPTPKSIARETTVYHIQADIPVAGYPSDMWLNRRDFERLP